MKTLVVLIMTLFNRHFWSRPKGLDRAKLAESYYYKARLSSGVMEPFYKFQCHLIATMGKGGIYKIDKSSDVYISFLRLYWMASLDQSFDKFDYDGNFVLEPPFKEEYTDWLLWYLMDIKKISLEEIIERHYPGWTITELNANVDQTEFLISLDLEEIISSSRNEILGLNDSSSSELDIARTAKPESDSLRITNQTNITHIEVAEIGKNSSKRIAHEKQTSASPSLIGWRGRFIEIFHAKTGSYEDASIRAVIWNSLNPTIHDNEKSDRDLVIAWVKLVSPASPKRIEELDTSKANELWKRYYPILGLSSIRDAENK